MSSKHPLDDFHPIVRRWFERTFGEPSPPQVLGWPSISSGSSTLILAPTGSGKTLAAFLWAINHLVEQHLREALAPGVRILYVSPLKALNNDIHRNLEEPLRGIREEARQEKLPLPAIHIAVRTGDTPQSRRAAMLRHPPDILITTPESLYLMLTSKQARKMFRTVQYVVIDEIHSVCGNKRGAHLSLSLERLQAVAEQECVRIGLSATQRPLDQIAGFLGGQDWRGKELAPRRVTIVDAGQRKHMDLRVECVVPDFSTLPQESVWPMIFRELLENIRSHRTTLIFVNNRRLAERVAAKLNELITDPMSPGQSFNLYAVPTPTAWSGGADSTEASENTAGHPASDVPFVQAYHGSMSRQAREKMEADLKAGTLRALVATSSLELGIDIGSIDLVIQLQSPKGVARGVQRVGRSGHLVTATSKGRLFPTHREDLVESVVVAGAMMRHDIEHTTIPRDCLDVLAQHIVAMVSVEEWGVHELFDLIRKSYCYQHLSKKLFLSVIQMLAGRYTHEAFRELRARISWDKVNNTLRALPGSSQLAITSGGTIADRGAFGVYLEDRKTKVGEVDEEFVYESRAGDTFILGTNVWRMIGIDANRITVAPAPGQPARMPFWRGEGIGRSYELGKLVGAFRRELSEKIESPDCLHWLQEEFPVDSSAAWNVREYIRRQQQSTEVVPSDKLLLVEGFRDEIGDPRIVVHSAFGRRVNGLLGLVLSFRLNELTGVESQMLYNDNGVLFRCSDRDSLPLNLFDGLTLRECEERVLDELVTSPLFGGQFRQNAARALLMPKIAPGKRTPLWLQRLRAGDLLQIARQFDDFPIVIETIRDVLNDVLDLEHFREVIRGIEDGSILTSMVHTETPSPFAASLLFDFIAVYMYEWDQPRQDKQSQYLAINREILSEIVDLDSMESLIRPEAVHTVEQQLQRTAEGYRARSPEELLEILLRIGDLTAEEISQRCVGDATTMVNALAINGRAVRVQFGDGSRWIAGEEQSVYAQRDSDRNLAWMLRRYLQNHGPVSSHELAHRYGIEHDRVNFILEGLKSTNEFIQGHFIRTTPGRLDEQQWCYRPNVERVHRQTIAILRKEITPSRLPDFIQFLFRWQHLLPGRQETGPDGLQTCLAQLQGLSLPVEIWEREILGRRVHGYATSLLSHVTSTGSVVWAGSGQGKMRPVMRGEGSTFLDLQSTDMEATIGEPAKRVLSYLRLHGASFFNDIRTGARLALDATNNGIAELFWNGLITNDVFAELQAVRRPSRRDQETPIERIEIVDPRHNPQRGRLVQRARKALRQVPGWTGRWSLVHLPGVMGEPLSIEERARRQALQFLDRYGIVAREFCRREDLLPWPIIATEFQRMEMRGEIRKGYFVEGLSGMQYALPAAVEELQRARTTTGSDAQPLLLNACDPANPYGSGVDLPMRENSAGETGSGATASGFARVPGNYLVFLRGVPVLFLASYGKRIWTLGETDVQIIHDALRAFVDMIRLPGHLRPFSEVTIEHCDALRPTQSPFEPILRSLGFRAERNQTLRYDGY